MLGEDDWRTPPPPRPRRLNAIVLRLYDAPPHRDPLVWWTAVVAVFVAFAIATSPSTSGMPTWLNTLLAVVVMTGLFAVLPAYLRLVVRRLMWRRRNRSRSVSGAAPARDQEPRGDAPPPSPPAHPPAAPTRTDRAETVRTVVAPTAADPPHRSSGGDLPYPIARALRAVATAATEKERYVAVLDAADAISVTVGVVATARLRAVDPRSAALQTLREAYARGVTQGTWQQMITASAREPSAGSDMPGLDHAVAPARRGNLLKHLGTLTEERNRWAHGAAPRTEADAISRLVTMRPTLDAAVARSAFLNARPWVVTQSCSYRVQDRSFDVRTAIAMGDHPEFARSAMTSPVPLADERVYVVGPGSETLDLTPFVVWRHCSECRKPELFLVDRRSGAHAVLKSFDGGHIMSDADLTSDLDLLGSGE